MGSARVRLDCGHLAWRKEHRWVSTAGLTACEAKCLPHGERPTQEKKR